MVDSGMNILLDTDSSADSSAAEPPRSGPRTFWPEDKVIQHIESLSYAITTAINDEIFDPDHPVYAAVSPVYRSLGVVNRPTSPPNALQRSQVYVTNSEEPEYMTLATALAKVQRVYQFCPAYRVKVEDLSTSVNIKRGIGQVFVKCKIEGVPEGMGRSTMTNMKWQRVYDVHAEDKEKWLLIQSKSLSGVEMGP